MTGESYFPSGAKEEQARALGNAVHRYLAALPSMASLGDEQKLAIAERCLTGASTTGLLPATTVAAIGERLKRWIDEKYPGADWATEVPITGPRADGGQWIGAIDLLLTLPDGRLVIIDHKSAPVRSEQAATKAGEFGQQLRAYREILESAGEKVAAASIHFSLTGVVATLQADASVTT